MDFKGCDSVYDNTTNILFQKHITLGSEMSSSCNAFIPIDQTNQQLLNINSSSVLIEVTLSHIYSKGVVI